MVMNFNSVTMTISSVTNRVLKRVSYWIVDMINSGENMIKSGEVIQRTVNDFS